MGRSRVPSLRLLKDTDLLTTPRMFVALIARTTSLKFLHDSQRKYFVPVDIGNVPKYKILFSKTGQIGYVTRAVNKP